MILDHVDGLSVPNAALLAHGNALSSLGYLSQGLAFLDHQMKELETHVYGELDPTKVFSLYGNAPGLEDIPMGLVACSFHWYAVSACNLVRLVGWLAHGQDPKQAAVYVEHVIPTVKLWRDKVAAHFAIADPRDSGRYPDSPADLAKSVMFPVGFHDRAFWTSEWTLSLGSATQSSTSRDGMVWSLTETHRELGRRYWPSTDQGC